MEDSEHLQWIHDRLVNVHGESEQVDYMIKFREIIGMIALQEETFKAYMKYVVQKRKDQNEKIENQPDGA